MKRKSLLFVAAAAVHMTVVAGTTSAPGQSEGLGLKNIQLSSELSPVIKLDPGFASSVYAYTAVVDSTNVKSIKIVPIPASGHDAVTINGAEAGIDKPYRTELKPGDNRFVVSAAVKPGKPVQYTLTIVQKDLSGQYKTEAVQKGIWRITDHFGFPPSQDAYLVEGTSKAVLIDAAMGKGDLPGVARRLTSLPIEIAVTHGHGDHIGQLNQFAGSAIYMSEKDRGMLPKAVSAANFKWIKDGDAIDLGGRSLEVIEMPGHTEGSLLFLDRVAKTLAVGDAIGSGSYVWKFTGKSSLAEYKAALERLEERIAGFDSLTFLTGHHWQETTPLTGAKGKQMVTDMKILCEKIIGGEIVGTPPSGNPGIRGAKILTASYGLAGIWYDPDNIQPAK